jgi:hypothetical protein
VPHVRLSVRGPKMMGAAQRSLFAASTGDPSTRATTRTSRDWAPSDTSEAAVTQTLTGLVREQIDWICKRTQRERSLGFAHLFRPTYAEANVGHPSIPSNAAMTQAPSGLT